MSRHFFTRENHSDKPQLTEEQRQAMEAYWSVPLGKDRTKEEQRLEKAFEGNPALLERARKSNELLL